ncbi:hypothetical protein [Nannocystis punicea]|uniref:Arylsulfotransferase (ASST) n=1 Tax=Nannocystis punicea TaxID=2995304 RepID=A0ABY7HAB6_9BACT|nr:hypothetical protein [Nannocystis poenicansa]WAS96202.1 hypothetical protein O0S08_08565 [Nannocystis poenicansa]
MPRFRARLALALTALAPACIERPPGEPAEVPAVTIALADSEGHELEWLSANARFVVLAYRPEPHSELRYILHDTVGGAREAIDALVAYDRRDRWAVVQLGQRWWLLDAETGERVQLARDWRDDEPEPLFSFGRRGRALATMRVGPDRVVVHDLATGDARDVYVPSSLLGDVIALAEPGWILFEGIVAAEAPPPRRPHRCPLESDTSCRDDVTCLAGTHVETIHALLHRDGAAIFFKKDEEPDVTPMLQVRDGWAWEAVHPHEPAGEHWLSADGCEHALPRGCAVDPDSIVWLGRSTLNCGERGRFLWSSAGLEPLPYFRGWFAEAIADGRGGLWRPAAVESPEGPRVARVSLDDGRMWVGPVVPYEGTNELSSHGWYLHDSGPGAPRVLAYDLTSGRTWQLPGAQLDPSGALRVGAAWHVLDLDRGRKIVVDHAPAAVAANGCALMPPGEAARWSLRCPEDRALRLDE